MVVRGSFGARSAANLAKAKASAKRFFGGAKKAASGAATATKSLATRASTSSAAAALGREAAIARGDTIGDIVARQTAPGIASLVHGGIDASPVGQSWIKATGDMIELSTALTVLGAGARGLGWDKRYLGKHVARANVAGINAAVPRVLYGIGRRLGSKIPDWRTKTGVAGIGSAEKPNVSGAALVAEVVPGEATMS